jgi:hypothetical protein
MAKSKARKHPTLAGPAAPPSPAVSPQLFPLGYDPNAKIEQRNVDSSKEGWSEYKIDDGTVIRTKAAIVDVKKVVDQYDLQGNPIYIYQFAIVSSVDSPKALKKRD